MSLPVAILGVAHVHAPSYAACLSQIPEAHLESIWDHNPELAQQRAKEWGCKVAPSLEEALKTCQAAIIASENLRHGELVEACAKFKRPVLCEKPLAGNEAEAKRIHDAVKQSGIHLQMAFPCPYSPAFERVVARVKAGDIGEIVAINTTNRGTCPFGWFVEPELSGGGAMIDHTVHVSDLLRRLLGTNPVKVSASIGSNMYGKDWDDTAMLTLDYPGGIFATLDSSWSRPQGFVTWGDVTLTVVGTRGVLEADLFLPHVDVYKDGKHSWAGFGTNLDLLMVSDFIHAITREHTPRTSLEDGLAASAVAVAAYQSVKAQQPVQVSRSSV